MPNLMFSNFKIVAQANTREGGPLGQSFKLKFRTFFAKNKSKGTKEAQSNFEFSEVLFQKLNLEDKDTGLVEIVSPSGTSYLAVVNNEHAVYLKTTKKNEKGVKGKVFKSSLLEKSLSDGKIIDLTIPTGTTQKLDLVFVPDSIGAPLNEDGSIVAKGGVYEIVKDTTELTEAEKAEDAKTSEVDTVEETPEVNTEVPETVDTKTPAQVETPVAEIVQAPATPAVAVPEGDDF